ncbi:hypothetical protein HDU89_001329 [Geranomyces variabilis]|nr:hypothetical protein HDU89_001329 [Geranomyces variabilis]
MEDSTISLTDDPMETVDIPGPDAAYDAEETRDSRDLRERDDARRGSTSRTANGGSNGTGVTSPVKHEGGSSSAAAAGGDRSYRGRSRSRSRSPRRSRHYDDREGGRPASKFSGGPRDPSRPSNKDCRVYVGNLAYTAELEDLKSYMRSAGEIVFADILTLPGGRSKGCGIVEYATPEEAQNAIRDLNDTQLMGRSVFIREDREADVRLGSSSGGASHYGGRRGGRADGCSLFVGNLPYHVGWQDLKDHFRQAGRVARADVLEGPDRRSRGMGTVVFETPEEAANAISMFDRTEFLGRRLEVREDRGPHVGGRGPPPAPYRPYDRPAPPRGGYESRGYYRDDYGYPPPAPPSRDYYGGGYGAPAPYGGGGGYGGRYEGDQGGYYGGYGAPPPPHGHGGDYGAGGAYPPDARGGYRGAERPYY